MKKLIIIGDGGFAHCVFENFTENTNYQVCAFVVEKAFIKKDNYLGLPVVEFEDIESIYPPHEYDFFVGIGGNQLNQLRIRFYEKMKEKGYKPAFCISKKASVSKYASMGEHCCIFENVVIHPGCEVGNNVIIMAQTFLGEYSKVDDNSFIAGLVSLAGYSSVGKACYVGTHTTVLNSVHLADNCVSAAGSVVTKNTEQDTLVRMSSPQYLKSAYEHFMKWYNKVSARARGKNL